jgi:CMP/dCMP kinase
MAASQPAPTPARHLTIGGLPGTGTTTACRSLEKQTGLPYVYAGQIFRDMAKAKAMTLEQFGRYCEEHAEVDRSIDDRQVELLKGPPILLEGRMSGFLAHREHLPAYKVWFTCDPWVRADRIVRREGGEIEDRMEQSRRREESERTRYIAYYGYDPTDLSVYDLVLDSTHKTPEEVVEEVLRGYRSAGATKRPWYRFWS